MLTILTTLGFVSSNACIALLKTPNRYTFYANSEYVHSVAQCKVCQNGFSLTTCFQRKPIYWRILRSVVFYLKNRDF